VARLVAALAARSGFAMTVADWRPACCNRTHLPDADALLVGFPLEIEQQLALCIDDTIIILTHHIPRNKMKNLLAIWRSL